MIRAVIFDMFETLITLYQSPIYFGSQIAEDVGIPVEQFLSLWNPIEYERSIGKLTFEDAMKNILSEYHCYSEELVEKIKHKRINSKREAFCYLHPEVIPMLSKLKENGFLIGLISNTFSEEEIVIRESILFSYFDTVFLSSEQGVCKPDEEIFNRCMKSLSVRADECVYIGDGGSYELETAQRLGMKVAQAVWYLRNGTMQPAGRKKDFVWLEKPFDVLNFL